MFDSDTLSKILEGAAKYEKVVVDQAADLIDQTLKFFIFKSFLGIVQAGAIFILLYVILKLLGYYESEIRSNIAVEEEVLERNKEVKTIGMFDYKHQDAVRSIARLKKEVRQTRLWKSMLTAVCCFLFFLFSIPKLVTVGKILIAPKLFIIEQTAKLAEEGH